MEFCSLLSIGLLCAGMLPKAFASSANNDSLLQVLEHSKEDTNKANTLFLLSEICEIDEIIMYAQPCLVLSQKLNFKKGIANAANNIGFSFKHYGELDSALVYYLLSLKLRRETNDKQGVATSLNNIAAIYDIQGKIQLALDFNMEALKIREEIADQAGIANSLNNLGMMNMNLGQQEKALEHYLRAMEIRRELKDTRGIAVTSNNIGMIYNLQGELDKALEFFHEAYNMHQEMKNVGGMGQILNNIGAIYKMKGDTDIALKYILQSLELKQKIQDNQGVALAMVNIAGLYYRKDNLEVAEKYCRRSLELATNIGNPMSIRNASLILSSICQRKGEYKEAYEMHVMHKLMADSLMNEDNKKSSIKRQMQYEAEKREQAIHFEQMKKDAIAESDKRRQTIIIYGTLVLAFILLIFLIVVFKERRKSEELLLNILPLSTARELKKLGYAKPRSYEMATVMFTDFKDFTAHAEKMNAETLVKELDQIFGKFDEIISKHGLEKIKTIGDAYMCAGGIPTPNTTHPAQVVDAALEIMEFMKNLNNGKLKLNNDNTAKNAGNSLSNCELRIGIHSGPLVAGVVGSKKFAYDIWGDSVNTASRMESSGEAGKVNISGTTFQLLTRNDDEQKLSFVYRGEIAVKNKGNIKMYFVDKQHD